MMLASITGCNETPSSSDSEVVDSSTPEETVNRPNYDYKLEENEKYQKASIKKETLSKLSYNSVKISGIDSLAVDPYQSVYYYGEVTLRYPNAELLNNQIVLYTSAWYSQKTFKRSDEVIEYVILNEEGMWYVSEISNTSETFIPFNGLVLSVPKSSSITYNVYDIIDIQGSIPTYDVGFYNQEGNRIAVSHANHATWSEHGVNLIDSNMLSKVTNTRWFNLATVNFVYDKDNNQYICDKFRFFEEDGKIYSNVHNGFMLGASISSNNFNVSVLEGVRFNDGDIIKVEEGGDIHTRSYDFSLKSTNTITLENGNKLSFTLAKSETNGTSNKWQFEAAVDKTHVIVETGSRVAIPEGGYKIDIRVANGTTGEKSNILTEEIFLKGSRVSISGSEISISHASTDRVYNLYNITNSYLKETLKEIEEYNYSYDLEGLKEIEETLATIKEEMNSIEFEEDPTYQYRLYTLMGEVNQLYFKILSATNRNEAVSVKTTWYINNYKREDKDLDSLKKSLDYVRSGGINEIIVDVFEGGLVNYSNSEIFGMDVDVKGNNYGEYGNDFFKAIISEAHKRNMKVFANFTPFSEGLEKVFDDISDAWALSMDGKDSVSTSQGAVKMLDPANQKVQEKIQIAIDDILKCNPELDGIHLDYIRYGADACYIDTAHGITEAARVGFNQYCAEKGYPYNYSSMTEFRNGLRKAVVFNRFNEFQQNAITNTVKNIKDVCLKYDSPLTCAVADDYSYVSTWKCQDWGLWAQQDLVDGLYIMDYYFDEYYINYYFQDMVKATKNNTLLVCGIDPSYADLVAEYYPKTIKGALKSANSHGYGIFGSHTQAAKKDGWDLIVDSNWIDSLSPYDELSKTMKASGDLLLKRCDDIYIKYNNQTADQKQTLATDLDALYALITGENAEVAQALVNKLDEMIDKTYASNAAEDRIDEQLKYMRKIAKSKYNTYR